MSKFHNKWRSFLNEDKIPGGLADKVDPQSQKFDPAQLAKGIRVEMEHTDDPKIAAEIARDHLLEDPNYYDKLATIEETQVLREISWDEYEKISDWMGNNVNSNKLSFNNLFGDKKRIMIPMGEPPPEWSTIKDMIEKAGWTLDIRNGIVTRQKEIFPPNREGEDYKSKIVEQKMKIGKWLGKAEGLASNHKKAYDEYSEYWQKYKRNDVDTNPENHLTSTLDKLKKKSDMSGEKLIEFAGARGVGRIRNQAEREGFEPLKNFWNKESQFFRENPDSINKEGEFSIIISRSPIDVLRMSDYEDIQSCHSVNSDYYGCAVVEAQGAGLVAYVVKNSDVSDSIDSKFHHLPDDERTTQLFLDQDEVFADQATRNVSGITPKSRVRLRKFTYDLEDDDGVVELAIPETAIYGKRFPEFYNEVAKWGRAAQENAVNQISQDDIQDEDEPSFPKHLSNFTLHGGEYMDGSQVGLFNKFFSDEYGTPIPADPARDKFEGQAHDETERGEEYQDEDDSEEAQAARMYDEYVEEGERIEYRYNQELEHCSIHHEVEHHDEYPYIMFGGGIQVSFEQHGIELIKPIGGGNDEWQERRRAERELLDEILGFYEGSSEWLIGEDVAYDNDSISWSFYTDESPDPDGFDAFGDQVLDLDKSYEKLVEAVFAGLESLGYIEKTGFGKIDKGALESSFEHLYVDIEADTGIDVGVAETEFFDISVEGFADYTKNVSKLLKMNKPPKKMYTLNSILQQYTIPEKAFQKIINNAYGYAKDQMSLPGLQSQEAPPNFSEFKKSFDYDFQTNQSQPNMIKFGFDLHFRRGSSEGFVLFALKMTEYIDKNFDDIGEMFQKAFDKSWLEVEKQIYADMSDVDGIQETEAYIKKLKESEPFQDAVKSGHTKKKKFYITTGGSKSTGVSGVKKPDTKRSKSAPPGFGGS